MVFECFDSYGRKKFEVEAEIPQFQFEPVLIEVGGEVFQSFCYKFDGGKTIAKCAPTTIIKIDTTGVGNEEISEE